MDLASIKAIAQLVGYLIEDEDRDWSENGEPEHHIVHDVVKCRGIVLDWCDMVEGSGLYKGRDRNPYITDEEIEMLRQQVSLSD